MKVLRCYDVIAQLFKFKMEDMIKAKLKIPGASFSLNRALGITQAKQKFARETGIPTSKAGLERKIGGAILKMIFGK